MDSDLESKHFKITAWIRIQKIPFELLCRPWVMKCFLPIIVQNIATQIIDVTTRNKDNELIITQWGTETAISLVNILISREWRKVLCNTITPPPGISSSLQKQPDDTKLTTLAHHAHVTSCYRSKDPPEKPFLLYIKSPTRSVSCILIILAVM
jgi:hypothetical protein